MTSQIRTTTEDAHRLLAWARSAAVRLGCVEAEIVARGETIARFEII